MTSYDSTLVDRFRVALKFSLWTWALYWPGGGILLLTGGMDPISILVVLGSLACFVMLVLTGALRTTSSRNMREFLMERPIYFIAAVAVLAMLTPVIAPLASAALVAFASVYLAGMVFVIVRLVQLLRSEEASMAKSGLDQAFVAIGLTTFAAFLIFADAWLTVFNGEPISGPPATVAIANWVNLLYPPLMLLATRGLREPLRKPKLTLDEESEAPDAVQA